MLFRSVHLRRRVAKDRDRNVGNLLAGGDGHVALAASVIDPGLGRTVCGAVVNRDWLRGGAVGHGAIDCVAFDGHRDVDRRRRRGSRPMGEGEKVTR